LHLVRPPIDVPVRAPIAVPERRARPSLRRRPAAFRRRGARHLDPRPPGDRPQERCELPEPGVAVV